MTPVFSVRKMSQLTISVGKGPGRMPYLNLIKHVQGPDRCCSSFEYDEMCGASGLPNMGTLGVNTCSTGVGLGDFWMW